MEAKLKSVIEALIAKTRTGEVNWLASSAEDEFCLYLDQSTITIGSIPEFTATTYLLRIYNSLGDLSVEFEADTDTNTEERALLEQLYMEAQKSFRNENQTLDSIMEELKKDGVVGNDSERI